MDTTNLISGTAHVSADLAFYGMALLVLVACILAPADRISWDPDGALAAFLAVPFLSVLLAGLVMDLAFFDHMLVFFWLTPSRSRPGPQ